MGTRCAQGVRISMAMTLAATATPIGASQALSPPQPGAGSGLVTVQRVVDGDTLDVVRDGRHVRVRLLNINTPETVDPNRAAECGGPDASDWLRQRLPAGSAITLTHDVELLDRYGRELALVTAADGGVVNVEIARNGLGEAVRYEPNQRFYPQVLRRAGAGQVDRLGAIRPRDAVHSGGERANPNQRPDGRRRLDCRRHPERRSRPRERPRRRPGGEPASVAQSAVRRHDSERPAAR